MEIMNVKHELFLVKCFELMQAQLHELLALKIGKPGT